VYKPTGDEDDDAWYVLFVACFVDVKMESLNSDLTSSGLKVQTFQTGHSIHNEDTPGFTAMLRDVLHDIHLSKKSGMYSYDLNRS
jgi:hypothetical protein